MPARRRCGHDRVNVSEESGNQPVGPSEPLEGEAPTPSDTARMNASMREPPSGAQPQERHEPNEPHDEHHEEPLEGQPDDPPPENPASVERTSRETAEERRRDAVRRYEDAADRGSPKRQRRRHKRRREPSVAVAAQVAKLPLERALEACLGVALLGAVLALGSVHPPVMAVVGGVSTLALTLALLVRTSHSPPLVGPALVAWLLAGWCLVQLLPLPMSWLAAIAPSNADIWERSLLALGEPGPAYASISLDPGATLIEACRWFSYGAVLTAAAEVAHRRGARWVIGLVFATAVTTALVTLGHGLSGMTRVYGFYEPSFQVSAWHIGPLLNANNLAGLLNLGTLCGLGLMLSLESHESPWLAVTGVALIVGVGIISASRGGVLLLLAGVTMLGLWVELPLRRARRGPPLGRARAMVGATLVMGVALALLGAREAVWNELLDENMEKLRLLGDVEPAVRDFPVLGMGRGAFESVFAAYQTTGGGVVFTHAENFVAHWIAEWGAPLALLGILAFAFFLRPGRMGVGKSALAAACWFGIMVVLAQNLVDLGLEVPGVALSLAVAIGALWGDPDVHHRRHNPVPTRAQPLRWPLVALTVGVSIAALGFWFGRHTVTADRTALRERLLSHPPGRPPAEVAGFQAELRAAILRHPAEPYFPLLGAELAWQERSDDAIPWLQRVLERSAMNGRAHLLLARVLERLGVRHQALLELRLAAESEHALVGHAASYAARWASTLEALEQAAPTNDDAAHYWDAVAVRLADRALAEACDHRALELDPTRVGPRERLVRDIVERRAAGKDCIGEREAACARAVEEHAAVAEREAPNASTAATMRASWLDATGQKEAAEKLLATVCETAVDVLDCLRRRVNIAASMPGAEPFGEAAKALRRAACTARDACADINTAIGDLHSARKEHALAVTSYEKAVRDHVTNERLQKLADAATSAGLSSRAMRALERLIERTSDPAERAALEARRREVTAKMLR